MQWFECFTKMPPYGVDVLVYFIDQYYVKCARVAYRTESGWSCNYSYKSTGYTEPLSYVALNNVTHWCPLPKFPDRTPDQIPPKGWFDRNPQTEFIIDEQTIEE